MKLSDAQVAALAEIEREHGAARHVPHGPLRDRLMWWSGRGALPVQIADDDTALIITVSGSIERVSLLL